jgi:hypothetical protein
MEKHQTVKPIYVWKGEMHDIKHVLIVISIFGQFFKHPPTAPNRNYLQIDGLISGEKSSQYAGHSTQFVGYFWV